MSSVIFLYSVCTDMKLGNSTKLYCLLTGMDHEIDFCCYPLITGKLGLPAFKSTYHAVRCSRACSLFSLITYRACLASIAKCVAHFLNCSRFECQVFRIHQTHCAFGQMLCVSPIGQMHCAFDQMRN